MFKEIVYICNDLKYLFKSPKNIFFWFFNLPIFSFIITLQIIIGIFWFFMYFLEFFMKYIKHFFKVSNIDPIFYKDLFKFESNNIINLFFIIIFEIPKKWAFFYFYQFIFIIYMIENKSSILKVFKNYKLFMKFFNKIIINYILKIIFIYPLIVFKHNTYIIRLFHNLWNTGKASFSAFYSNFILNILLTFLADITSQIKDRKIRFDENEIYTNPSKIDPNKIVSSISSIIKNKTDYNIALDIISNRSYCILMRYNTSQPFIVNFLPLDLNKNFCLNTGIINQNQLLYSNSKYSENIDNEEYYIIKSNTELNKLNQKLHYTIAGYNEKEDFIKYTDKNILNTHIYKKSLISDFFDEGEKNFQVVLQPHIVSTDFQIKVNVDDVIKNYTHFNEEKKMLVKHIMYYYNKNLLEYQFIDAQNKLVFDKYDFTLRDFLLKNAHKFDNNIQNAVESLENHYQDNKILFDDLNNDNLLYDYFCKEPFQISNIAWWVNRQSEKFESKVYKKLDLDNLLDDLN